MLVTVDFAGPSLRMGSVASVRQRGPGGAGCMKVLYRRPPDHRESPAVYRYRSCAAG